MSGRQEQDEKLGAVHQNLQGWIPPMASEEEIRAALENAFDYRGDLTITLKDGQNVVGYIFDRRAESRHLVDCIVRVIPTNRSEKVSIRYSDIAGLEFTGKDTAEGKSFEAWVKQYREKKARGEKDIGIESEPLD